jgi:hypothetical protein
MTTAIIKNLPTVLEFPTRWNHRILLAYVLAEMKGSELVQLSGRRIQEDLCQVATKSVRWNLLRLRDDGWLHLETPGRPGKGGMYSLGHRLLTNQKLNQEWQEWANAFFGLGGVATHWKGTDALAYGSLGAHGLLILERIEQEGGHIHGKVLRTSTTPVIARGSVEDRLNWLQSHELIRIDLEKTAGRDVVTLNADWRARLASMFPKEGSLSMRIKVVNQQDRKAFYAARRLAVRV